MSDGRRDGRLFVGLIIGSIVVFAVAVTTGSLLDATPGSLADWIAAVSTFAALLAASYAAIQTSRTFALEQKRDHQRDLDVSQRQAVQVAVWGGEAIVRRPVSGPLYPESWLVSIKNASPLPVFNFDVEFHVTHPEDGLEVLVATYSHETAVVGELEGVEVITPEVVESLLRVFNLIPGADQKMPELRIGWSFEDVAGLRWQRLPDGQLRDRTLFMRKFRA